MIRPSWYRRAFTLLEVMVATAILGLTLTVILSAEGGLAASGKSTANVGMAISLARCKMTEAEDKVLRYGYPIVDDIQLDQPCCNDEDVPGFKCDMRTELILMPNPPVTGLDGGSLALSSSASPTNAASGAVAGALPGLMPTDTSAAPGGVPSALAGLGGDGGLGGLGDGGIATLLTQQMGGGGLGTQGLLSMVMGFVYPFIKPMMEASIRRVTVTVRWTEGAKPKEFSILQYITNPSNGGFGPGPDGGATPASSSSSSTSTASTAAGATNVTTPASPMPQGGLIQR
jgi:general secretion pathway protein I